MEFSAIMFSFIVLIGFTAATEYSYPFEEMVNEDYPHLTRRHIPNPYNLHNELYESQQPEMYNGVPHPYLVFSHKRITRSTQPGTPGGNNGNSRNGVDVSVNRQRGVGTSVSARGERTWRSNNGNTEVRVHGQYDRVIRGPQRGARDYNVGASITHRWK